MRDVARRCGEALGLGLYGIDIIEGRQGLSVVDVNYFPGYKGVANAAPLIAAYIEAYAREQIRLPPPPPAFPPASTVRLREVADVDEAAPS